MMWYDGCLGPQDEYRRDVCGRALVRCHSKLEHGRINTINRDLEEIVDHLSRVKCQFLREDVQKEYDLITSRLEGKSLGP